MPMMTLAYLITHSLTHRHAFTERQKMSFLWSSLKAKIKLLVNIKMWCNDCRFWNCERPTMAHEVNAWIRSIKIFQKTTFYHWNVIVIGLLMCCFLFLIKQAQVFKEDCIQYTMAKNKVSRRNIWTFRWVCNWISAHLLEMKRFFFIFKLNIIYCANKCSNQAQCWAVNGKEKNV